MTGADKVVCQAATLLLLFTLTSVPAKAQLAGFGGGGGGGDMMTQMAPMLEMMKAKMGKRRFGMMMQTMGPMMGQMMEGGGGLGGMGGGIPGGFGGGGGYMPQGMRRRWRRADGHDSAADADGQFRRRRWPPSASPAALEPLSSLRGALATKQSSLPVAPWIASRSLSSGRLEAGPVGSQ
jgi:hypothetical protein